MRFITQLNKATGPSFTIYKTFKKERKNKERRKSAETLVLLMPISF